MKKSIHFKITKAKLMFESGSVILFDPNESEVIEVEAEDIPDMDLAINDSLDQVINDWDAEFSMQVTSQDFIQKLVYKAPHKVRQFKAEDEN